MGYQTTFHGSVSVEPPLNEAEISYLKDFSYTDHRFESNVPGYWCQWVPTTDGTAIKWDDGEKFYDSVEWMEYIIENFLMPDGYAQGEPALEGFTFNHVVNGIINAEGEESGDIWRLVVRNNKVTRQEPMIMWPSDDGDDE